MTQDARRSANVGNCTEISETMIARLVHAFYAKVRTDDLLGPIFNEAVEDWDEHLEKLCRFWSSVTLMSGAYKGRPVPAHLALKGLGEAHFARWLHLFRQTAMDECGDDAASVFIARAENIARSLQLAIAIHNGELTFKPATTTAPERNQES